MLINIVSVLSVLALPLLNCWFQQWLPKIVFIRDASFMLVLTVLLFLFGFRFKQQGRINRFEGLLLLISFIGYTYYLLRC